MEELKGTIAQDTIEVDHVMAPRFDEIPRIKVTRSPNSFIRKSPGLGSPVSL